MSQLYAEALQAPEKPPTKTEVVNKLLKSVDSERTVQT